MSNIRNIALMAHVDAGKTTLTERILYTADITRTMGSVDEGTTRTDNLEIERQRGISVNASFISFQIGDTTINMIDTPGHSDFYSQVERTFLAVDAVIVLVSAVDGVQSGTETIVAEALESNVPVVFFINKCDRELARREEVVTQIKQIRSGAFDYNNERYEAAATYDDNLMQSFCDNIPEDKIVVDTIISKYVKSCQMSPILYGSAYNGDGVAELLNFICNVLPPTDADLVNAPLSGVIFSVVHDKLFGRGAYVRLFSGTISIRSTLSIDGVDYKTTIVKQQNNGRWIDSKELKAGEIGLVYGLLYSKTGDIFGVSDMLPLRAFNCFKRKALLTAQIEPENEADNTVLKAALEMMTAEDPVLALEWEPVYGKMNINVMGIIQIETLTALIEERFGIKVKISEPTVIYKETLARPAIGFDAYTMPKPSWAVLKFQLTPAVRGSGVTYKCSVAPNKLPLRYRGQVEQSIAPSLKQGLYGWEVVDMDIQLIDGEDHPVHTHPLDFTIATPLALMDGLRNGGTILLEPILDVKFIFASQFLGRIISDVVHMRGRIESQSYRGENVVLNAHIPLASSLHYPVLFATITSGFGIMTQKLLGYRECPLELGKTCPRRGVDPSDRSKYILAARHAISGTVFEGG